MLRVGSGAAGDANGEGGAGDGPADAVGVGHASWVSAAGDADSEGVAGDAARVGGTGDADGEGAAGNAMVDGAARDALTVRVLQGMLWLTLPFVMTAVRVLQVMVLDGGPRVGGPSPLLAEGLLGVAGQLTRRSWRCWSPLVSGQLLANPGGGCRWCC